MPITTFSVDQERPEWVDAGGQLWMTHSTFLFGKVLISYTETFKK